MEKGNWILEIKLIILDPISSQITSAFDFHHATTRHLSNTLYKVCNVIQAYLRAYNVLKTLM